MTARYRLFYVVIVLLVLITAACNRAPNQDQAIKNIETFARLYGYVKYFYPGDGAAAIDWDKFAVYGVKMVEKARNKRELKQKLEALFLPLAPGVSLHDSHGKTVFSKSLITPADTTGMKVISWQHFGLGTGDLESSYKSIRLNRPDLLSAKNNFGNVMNMLNAQPYRGKEIKFKAAVKAGTKPGAGEGRLWLRVDRPRGVQGFFNNMGDKPITAKEWNYYDIQGDVANDASMIAFGCFLLGNGKLWVDDLQLYVKEGNNWQPVEITDPGFEEDKEESSPQDWLLRNDLYSFKVTAQTAAKGNKSLAVTRLPDADAKPLFERKAQFGEFVFKEIGSGLSCTVPLALYGTAGSTYPPLVKKDYDSLVSAAAKEAPAALSADDLYVRLADIVICWNCMRHFYPYFDVVKTDWQAALNDALKSAYNDKNKFDFWKTLRKFTARLKDGHVSVNLQGERSEFYYLPILWDWVEEKLVITGVFDESVKDIQVGDIVREIDGAPAKATLEKEMEYISAATKGWGVYRVLVDLLVGANDSPVSLKIERDNRVFQAKLIRSMDVLSYYERWIKMKEKSRKIADGIYYMDFYQVTGKDLETLLPELQKARSIICDLRGYPKDSVSFIMYLLKEKDTSTAWMQLPQIIYPDYERVTYQKHGWQLEALKPHLTARIIFIVDGRAISYAESYMSFIEHYKLATIIGQPTAGTNGNVNVIYLPGQYTVSFTGMRVVKHDGSQHHGVGIIPNIILNRTIKGVKEGRDEFLEKAIELAEK